MNHSIIYNIGEYVVIGGFILGIIFIVNYALKIRQIESFFKKNIWLIPILVILLCFILVIGPVLLLELFSSS